MDWYMVLSSNFYWAVASSVDEAKTKVKSIGGVLRSYSVIHVKGCNTPPAINGGCTVIPAGGEIVDEYRVTNGRRAKPRAA